MKPAHSWNWVAGLLCGAVVVVDSVACPVAVRAVGVFAFAIWVPGAILLWLLHPARREVRPGMPSVALSLSSLVVVSCLGVECGVFPSRRGFVLFAALCGVLIAVGEFLQHRRRSAQR